jgi:hypothetical protein
VGDYFACGGDVVGGLFLGVGDGFLMAHG